MFFICRVVARVLFAVRFYKTENEPGGPDYIAIWLYCHINQEKANGLMEKMFPVMD